MLRVLRRTRLAMTSLAACAVLAASSAHADPPPDDPLPAARALFTDGLHDEQGGHFAEALDKFERVRAVRDTASVEYRIGSCHEGLGEPLPAYRAYLSARTLAVGDPQSADIARAASERLDALSKQVAQLAITPAPSPAAPPSAASRSGAPPSAGPGSSAPSVEPPSPATASPATTPVESPPAHGSLSVAGWVAVGGAAAFLTASAVLLIARQNEIADLNHACPNGLCPLDADRSDLESTRHRAQVYGPVGVTSGIAGIGLAAAGIYWIASAHRPAVTSRWAVLPMVAREGAGLAFTGALP